MTALTPELERHIRRNVEAGNAVSREEVRRLLAALDDARAMLPRVAVAMRDVCETRRRVVMGHVCGQYNDLNPEDLPEIIASVVEGRGPPWKARTDGEDRLIEGERYRLRQAIKAARTKVATEAEKP